MLKKKKCFTIFIKHFNVKSLKATIVNIRRFYVCLDCLEFLKDS